MQLKFIKTPNITHGTPLGQCTTLASFPIKLNE